MHHPKEKHQEYHKMNNNKEKVYKSKYQKIIPKNRKFMQIENNKILILNNFKKIERSPKV